MNLENPSRLTPAQAIDPPADELDPAEEYAEEPFDDGDDDAYSQYRTLSISAVATLVLGVLSIAALVPVGVLLILPAVGTVLGLYAVWTVYSRREEFTGQRMAATGLGLSACLLVIGTLWHYFLNKVEVPEHYKGKEVSFSELQPVDDIDLQQLVQLSNRNVELPLPQRAKDLDGQEVFVTGYVLSDISKTNLKTFVLVPDMKTCCFGGQPKITDMIEVTLADPYRANFSLRRCGVGGVLKVHSNLQSRDQRVGVVYELEADYFSQGSG
jgi:hypothetical protein